MTAQGPTVVGSTGQDKLNPIYGELRLARVAIGRLVKRLNLPGPDGVVQTGASRRSSKAARRRWDQAEAERLRRIG